MTVEIILLEVLLDAIDLWRNHSSLDFFADRPRACTEHMVSSINAFELFDKFTFTASHLLVFLEEGLAQVQVQHHVVSLAAKLSTTLNLEL